MSDELVRALVSLLSWLALCSGALAQDPCVGDAQPNEDLCRMLEQPACDALRVRGEALARRGRHAEAAAALVELARQHQGCAQLDEVLFNAAEYFDAARLRGRAIRTRSVFLAQFPQSPLAPRVQFVFAGDYQRLAEYAAAANAYEEFARRYPAQDGESCAEEQRVNDGCPDARTALTNAMFFRVGLGDLEAARADVALFERYFARRDPEATQQIAFAYATALERAERWSELSIESARFLEGYGTASPVLALRAHALAARAHAELGQDSEAARHYDAIVRGYSDVLRSLALGDEWTDDAALEAARVRDVAGRALFRRTDATAEALLARRAPAPSSDIVRWAERTLAPWLARGSESIQDMSAQLERIAALEVPEWQIAAAERLGAIEGHLVREVESVIATLPDEARTPIRAMLEPFRQGAREGYEYCAVVSMRVRWPSEQSARCWAALTEMDPARFPPGPFELLGALSAEPAVAEPAPALDPELALAR